MTSNHYCSLCRDQTKGLPSASREHSEKTSCFTVACHPRLPQLACSDGYSVSLLEWIPGHAAAGDSTQINRTHSQTRTQQGLLGLVKGLVATSHRILEGSQQQQQNNSQNQMSMILDKKESILTGFEGDRSLDSLAPNMAGYRGAAIMSSTLKSLEGHEGQQNADSANLRQPGDRLYAGSVSEGATGHETDPLSASIPLLQAAAGVLLSCDPFVPFNGMLPTTKSLELSEISSYRSELGTATNQLLSLTFKVISELGILSPASPVINQSIKVNTLSQEFITSLLKLMAFDKMKQSKMDLSVSLANSIILGFLSGLSRVHHEFTTLQKDKHTLKALVQYTDWVTASLLDVYNLLEEVVCVLESTYATRHFVLGDILQSGHNPSPAPSMALDNQPVPKYVQHLLPSLNAALSVVSALWQDVKHSRHMVRSFRHLHATPTAATTHRGGWSPEAARLFKQFKESSVNATTTLKAVHYYIHHLLSSCKQLLSTSKSSVLKGGNPFTYTTSQSIKMMLEHLLQYNIREAMDVVNCCIQEWGVAEGRGLSSASVLSADHLSDILDSSLVNRPDFTSYICVRSEPARFIVGVLGDLMAAYFTNQDLLVLLTNITATPPRHAELSRSRLSIALREQELSDIWTVERAVNLLLLSGKWEKACDFIVEIGDWRKAFVLATAFTVHSSLVSKEMLHGSAPAMADTLSNLSHHLAVSNILKVIGSTHRRAGKASKPVADSDDSETDLSRRVCERFLSETFHVCALSGMDSVLRSCADHYLKELVNLAATLGAQVPPGLYLPAPPLFYIQPTLTEEVNMFCVHIAAQLCVAISPLKCQGGAQNVPPQKQQQQQQQQTTS